MIPLQSPPFQMTTRRFGCYNLPRFDLKISSSQAQEFQISAPTVVEELD